MQNRKRIRQAAACYTKIETAEAAGKKNRAWVVDGNTMVLKVLVPAAFEEDRAEVLEALAVDRAVVRKEVPAAVLEVPVALAADRTDNTENREADREPALASAVLAGAPAYV